MDKIISPPVKENDNSENTTILESSFDTNACLDIDEKEKFMFFISYRGKPTEQLAKSFRKLNAPCKLIMTTKKTKHSLPHKGQQVNKTF